MQGNLKTAYWLIVQVWLELKEKEIQHIFLNYKMENPLNSTFKESEGGKRQYFNSQADLEEEQKGTLNFEDLVFSRLVLMGKAE